MSKVSFLILVGLILTQACPFMDKNQNLSYSPHKTGDAWQHQTASAKMSNFMSLIKQDQHNYGWYNPLSSAQPLTESAAYSMDGHPTAYMDDMPEQTHLLLSQERPKLIHSVGLAADCSYRSVGSHGYTGIFEGVDNVILRLSSAQPAAGSPKNVAPGIGVKFFRDNIHSYNLVSMYSLEGQFDSSNMFAHDFTNHVPNLDLNKCALPLKLLSQHFLDASQWPTMVGVSDGASYRQDGSKVSNPDYPYRLIFQPSDAAHNAFQDHDISDKSYYIDEIKGHKFDLLYKVYAQSSPSSGIEQIGEVTMNSPFYESKYGDKDFFIQHQRMEDDLNGHPEWVAGAQAQVDYEAAHYPYTFPDLPRSSTI